MKSSWIVLFAVLSLFLSISNSFADGLRETPVITLAEGSYRKFHLQPTDRLPGAHAAVRVDRAHGLARIEVNASGMKPAMLFGGDYTTYVVWAVSAGGRTGNLGEIILNGDESKLRSTTTLTAFAILITAEPHYLVTSPSSFVVLDNRTAEGPRVQYRVLEGIYNFERDTLAGVKGAKGKVQTGVKQAFAAFRLAQRAGATELASEMLAEAEQALDETLDLSHKRKDPHEVDAQARETVHLAVAAQNLARERASSAALEPDRKVWVEETTRLKGAPREGPGMGSKTKKER